MLTGRAKFFQMSGWSTETRTGVRFWGCKPANTKRHHANSLTCWCLLILYSHPNSNPNVGSLGLQENSARNLNPNLTQTESLRYKTSWKGTRFEAKIRENNQRRKMVSYVNILLYGVGGLVVAGMALLVAFQEKLVYVPVLPGLTKSYPITPSRLRLGYEDIWLRSSDGVRLHAWFIKLFPECRGSIWKT